MTDTLEDRTSCLGHKYNLIDALRRAKVQIKAGDFITDIAADRIAELEAENKALSEDLETCEAEAEMSELKHMADRDNISELEATIKALKGGEQ